jgi:hypothetical protein
MTTTMPITPSPRGAATPSNDARRRARDPAPKLLTLTGPFALLALATFGALRFIVT